jgi:hypothetical protein
MLSLEVGVWRVRASTCIAFASACLPSLISTLPQITVV